MFHLKIDAAAGARKVWLTSDLHLLHKSISGPERSTWKSGYRNFKDEYEMTEHILNNINKHVGHDDILINLGDFVFKNHKCIPEMRGRIVCQEVHHIIGNHDTKIEQYADKFSSMSDIMALNYHGNMFILCHYAMRVWHHMSKGVYHAYGHSHDSIDRHPNQPWGKSMDVGIDSAYRILGEYRPFDIKEVIKILSKRAEKPSLTIEEGL